MRRGVKRKGVGMDRAMLLVNPLNDIECRQSGGWGMDGGEPWFSHVRLDMCRIIAPSLNVLTGG